MALEDVVQSVEVQVNVTGADEAEARIGKLGESIQGLSEAANDAMTGRGGGGGGGGIKGLDDAFKNIGTTAAASFAQILSGVTSGNLTGLATLMGGPVAGSFTAAAEQISAFIDQQDAAILKTASMAKQFGSTPIEIQGMSAALGEAGVSSQRFERLVTRMSQRVATDYASMMKNIRTDNDTAESAALRLTKAQEALQESYGVPKEAFAAQDKYIEQRERSIAVDQAQEAVREQALKSIPHVTKALQDGIKAGKEAADVADTDINTLVKSIENMSRVGQGPAKPEQVLKNMMEAIRTGAIGGQQALALLNSEMGRMSRPGAGYAGGDAQRFIQFAKDGGWDKMQEATKEIAKTGLGLTDEDTKRASDAISKMEKLDQVWKSFEEKVGGGLSPTKGALAEGLTDLLECLPTAIERLQTAIDKVKPGGKEKSFWDALFGAMPDSWQKAFKDAEKAQDELFKKSKEARENREVPPGTTVGGQPVAPPGTWPVRVVRFGMGAPPGGTAEIYHVPKEGEAAPPPAAPGASGAPPGTSPVRVVRFGMGAPPGGTAEIYHVPKRARQRRLPPRRVLLARRPARRRSELSVSVWARRPAVRPKSIMFPKRARTSVMVRALAWNKQAVPRACRQINARRLCGAIWLPRPASRLRVRGHQQASPDRARARPRRPEKTSAYSLAASLVRSSA